LYVDGNPPHLVALGGVYKGLIIVHHVCLGNDLVKVGVEEVRAAYASVPVPTGEI